MCLHESRNKTMSETTAMKPWTKTTQGCKKCYGIQHVFLHPWVVFVHGFIVVVSLIVWFLLSCKHIAGLVAIPHFLYRIPDSWWYTHRWWILRPVLIPWHMFLSGQILLVGLGVVRGAPLLCTGIFFCREKLYELPLGECWQVSAWRIHCI